MKPLITTLTLACLILCGCKKSQENPHGKTQSPVAIKIASLGTITALDLKVTDQYGAIIFDQSNIEYYPLNLTSLPVYPGDKLTITYNTNVSNTLVTNADVEVLFSYNNTNFASISGSHFKTTNGYTLIAAVPNE